MVPASGLTHITASQSPFPVSGAHEDRQDASTVAVNVYARSTLHVGLVVEQDKLLAGREFNIALAARDLAGAEVSAVSAIGRLVAPRVSTNQALQDPETLPPARRKRFVVKAEGETFFDEPRYLGEYETKSPVHSRCATSFCSSPQRAGRRRSPPR
jgi:hypothetical protein